MKKIILASLFVLLSFNMQAISPYISRVWEFSPAPGQFTNLLPEYEDGDDAADMRLKAETAIADNNQGMVSLGGWGGYVVFGFDHPVVNVKGEYDFVVLGNAFYSAQADGQLKGSCEPGVVCVSYDANGNGKPDDEWYELAGSEYDNPLTVHNYSMTYYKTPADHVATPHKDNKSLIDTTFVAWEDNTGAKGHITQVSFHTQPYFPQWIEDNSLTFTGTRLPNNGTDESGNGTNYVLSAFDFGYADNHPNNSEKAKLNIEWAVDNDGKPVNLPYIHFVKVYTGLNQQCGWLGETSTEITGATDLHPEAEISACEEVEQPDGVRLLAGCVSQSLVLAVQRAQEIRVYDCAGRCVLTAAVLSGTNSVSCEGLQTGVYIIRTASGSLRFVKH